MGKLSQRGGPAARWGRRGSCQVSQALGTVLLASSSPSIGREVLSPQVLAEVGRLPVCVVSPLSRQPFLCPSR